MTVNKASEMKSTSRGKVKVAKQVERFRTRKYIKNLPQTFLKSEKKTIENIINCQLDMKQEQFTEDELGTILKKDLKKTTKNENPQKSLYRTYKITYCSLGDKKI